MNNFYQHSLNVAKEKYYKFKRRLEKKISSGQFDSLSRRKKNALISRVEKYRSRLDQLGFSVKGAAVAGSVAAMAVPAAVSAQTPYFKRGDQLPVSSTQSHVAVANIDDDSDMEILFSTTGGGKIMNRNDQGNFEYTEPYALSEMTREFLVGDIDGDNEEDIVFIDEYSAGDYLVTAINQGDGSFSTSSIGYITNIQDVELVDFDSDGDLDVVVANQSYYLYYYQNDGSGSFSGGSLGIGTFYDSFNSFAFADVDEDGDMDLIRNGGFKYYIGPGFSYRDRLVVQENTAGPNAIPNFGGEGSSIYTIEAGGESDIDDITLFDQDGDGDLDIAFRYRDNSSVNYIQTVTNLYDVSGYFAFSANGGEYLGSGSYGSIAVFDFDNDGDDDIIVDSSGFGSDLLRNDGGGSFTRYDIASGAYGGEFGQNSYNFAFGDFNNDSVDDVIATSSYTPAYIFENASEFDDLSLPVDEFSERTAKAGDKVGDFTARDPQTGSAFTPTVSIGGPDAGSFTVAGGEINVGSTDLDFETQSEFNITAQSTLNGVTKVVPITLRLEDSPEEGYGTFEKLTGGETDYRMGEAQMADIDGDGNDDLIFASYNGYGSIYWMNIAEGSRPQYLGYGTAFQVADLDGDGDQDIAIADGYYIYQYLNDGGGEFAGGEYINTFGNTIRDIEVVDFDNDGDQDFIVGTDGLGIVVKDFGTYFSNFGYFGSSQTESVALGDIDDDGFTDIIHTEYGSDYVSIVLNNEGNSLSYLNSYYLYATERVDVIDLDNDGDVDIVASGYRYVHLLDQTSPGASAPFTPITYAIESYSINESTIALGDFDGDEDIDIVVRQYNYNTGGEDAVVYLNDGSNDFNEGQSIEFLFDNNYSSTRMRGLAVGDVDGDDDLDIVAGLEDNGKYNQREIYVLENTNVAPYVVDFDGSVIIDENTPSQTLLGTLDTYDPNGDDISISLQGDDAGLFSINAEGEVRTEGDLDWESIGSNLDVSIVLSDGNSERIEEAPLKINNLVEGGSGTFSDEGLPLFGVQETRFFEPGDYDLDGDQDLFKSSFTNFGGEGGLSEVSETLDSYFPNSIFEQNNGTFGDNPIFMDPDRYVKYMIFQDVDNDGDMDMVANVYDDLYVFNNNGGEWTYQDNGNIYFALGMQFGDVDGDGSSELVALESEFGKYNLLTFEVNEGGELNQSNSLQIGGGSAPLLSYSPNAMAVADFDGDGFDDVLISTEGGDDYIFWGGEFGPDVSNSSVAITQSDNYLSEIVVADLDGDGDEDIAVLRRTSDGVDNLRLDVHINDGNGTFTNTETVTQGGEDYGRVQAGDIDGDGSIDLITTGVYYQEGGEGQRYYGLNIWANDGSGSFTNTQTIEEVGGEDFKLMDVDGDDDFDIIVSDRSGDNQYMRVFKNVNVAPTGISLSNTTIDEALPLGSAIATVSVEDPNPSDTHVTFIASGDGSNDADNANFVIDGDQLLVIRNIEFNDGSSLNINIRAIDQEGESVTQSFTLSVNEVLGLDDENSNFILYPNPGNEQIAISIDHEAQGSLELQVRDISGKLIHRLSGEKNAERWTGEISMLNQEPGIYVVEIDINGEKFSQRWIKK